MLGSGAAASPASEKAPREIELAVRGMTCGSCAARVETSLNRLPGVRAVVNLATERALVAVWSELPVERLLERVEAAGYRGELVGDGADREDRAEDDRRVRRLRPRLLVAAILFMPICEWSAAFSLLPWLRFPYWQWCLIPLAAPVVTWAAWPFHEAAWRAARHRTCTMDTLVSMGIVAATGWSLYAMFARDVSEPNRSGLYVLFHQAGGSLYLDVAAGVTAFLLAGRFFEAVERRRAGNAVRALAARAPKQVTLLQENGTELTVPVGLLQVEDRFLVRPGEIVAADGEILMGQSALDRSAMTGESLPIELGVGDEVLAGTSAVTGRLLVRAERVGSQTHLGHMVEVVARSQMERASVQRLADRISGVFVPAVILAAGATLAAWLGLGHSPGAAFSAALAVLIIACPCALGLATPAALRVAAGRGAQLGIFFKNHRALEYSQKVDTVVLDKTGTVTGGGMAMAEVLPSSDRDAEVLLRSAGALEQASEHLVATAIAEAARARFGALPQPQHFQSLPGLGAEGEVEGHRILVGRDRLFQERGQAVPPAISQQCSIWAEAGLTAVLISVDGDLAGALALADEVKVSAEPAVHRLRQLGLRCLLVTGDNQATASSVATALGIEEVRAGALPADKVELIRSLQVEGHAVAMVGDGVNDGPALVQADLGLAMGSGTDVAITAADLVLVRDDLRVVADAIGLARSTMRTIRVNLVWAFAYNLVALPLAALGLLDPLIAAAAMATSSAFVVWNSSRLRHYRAGRITGERGTAPAGFWLLRPRAPAAVQVESPRH